ncbi:hypothetical protein C8Q77DRAFT_1083602 [Trametes polyzona]|nr:hypothetical protein C8Q77DRAFT_1083602 [Trametes polyzona]
MTIRLWRSLAFFVRSLGPASTLGRVASPLGMDFFVFVLYICLSSRSGCFSTLDTSSIVSCFTFPAPDPRLRTSGSARHRFVYLHYRLLAYVLSRALPPYISRTVPYYLRCIATY